MYDQIRVDVFFLMFYASVAMLSLMACCYLLFRRANAIAPDVTPSARLRRWTAAFFAAISFCHLWYLPIIPLTIAVLLAMLQDRRRPLWPIAVIVAPLMVGLVWCITTGSESLLPVLYTYFLLMWLGLIIYMVREIRQYQHWLRDNYADLEHKEVWQSFVVLAIILLVYTIYSLDLGEPILDYAMEAIIIFLVCYLLWRVETLSDLNIPISSDTAIAVDDAVEETVASEDSDPLSMRNNIGPLLKQHCEDSGLYLQHDISVSQLAQTIGTNRFYLSQYFSSRGMTYNSYINRLRIQHFINLYREAASTHQPITVLQLAHQSGFRSYSTFNAAFKQSMGMTATEWMRNMTE